MFSQRQVTDSEFQKFREFIYNSAGIDLSPQKKPLVTARLNKRLRHYNLDTFEQYYALVERDISNREKQVLIDLLTTNETYFFREEKHFDFLKAVLLRDHNRFREFSLWSAASSSGEEAYSIAMTLADVLGDNPWRIVGSDLNSQVIEKAASGHYPMDRIEGIPNHYLKQFCLRGTGKFDGTLLVDKSLRARVEFVSHNLMHSAEKMGAFDVIFLRNVLIYFDEKTKHKVVGHLIRQLKPRGYFIIGHSDKFDRSGFKLDLIAPSIYRLQNV